jgi:uncharacterized surface anchored protein
VVGAATRRSSSDCGAASSREDEDSSGRPWARLGLILVGLIVASSPGFAFAQVVPVPVPTQVEKVADQVADTVEDVKRKVDDARRDVGKRAKKARRKARRAVGDISRRVSTTTEETRQDLTTTTRNARRDLKTTELRAKPTAKKKAQAQYSPREKKRRNRTAQEGNARGDRNGSGDILQLVDAGDSIEGTEVREQVEPQPQPQRESMPATGFEPRTFLLLGLTMIVTGLLLLASRPRAHPVPGW